MRKRLQSSTYPPAPALPYWPTGWLRDFMSWSERRRAKCFCSIARLAACAALAWRCASSAAASACNAMVFSLQASKAGVDARHISTQDQEPNALSQVTSSRCLASLQAQLLQQAG